MSRKPLLALLGALFLAGCNTLTAFNAVTPKDPAVRLGQALAYGDNPRHRLDVYAPREMTESAPVVVFFYGGGWYEGRRQDYAFAAHALAARGFVVVVPDYRLYPEVTYPAFLEDGAEAVAWTVENVALYGGDPGRILLAGHSAGAYNAVHLALNTRFLEAAGVDPGVIRGAAGLAGPYDFLPLAVPETQNAFGPYDDLRDTQPIYSARAGAPPIFLAHGTADDIVALYNTQHLEIALGHVEAPVEVKVYEGLSHTDIAAALSIPFRGKAPVLADLSGFLRRASEN